MNRNTEWYKFTGISSFDHVTQPDLEFNNWNIRVHLDEESLAKFEELKKPLEDGTEGILNESKMDDDGVYVTFKRPMSRKWNGVDTMLTPPVILDKDENAFEGRIGSGSKVTVKCEVYKYNKPFKKGKGRAMRLLAVKVLDHVPYTKSNFTESEEKQASGFKEPF